MQIPALSAYQALCRCNTPRFPLFAELQDEEVRDACLSFISARRLKLAEQRFKASIADFY